MTLMFSSTAKPITRCREEQTSLLEYSNENRKKGKFCDVIIQSGGVTLPAHKLVLSCYCRYFKNKFNSPANEECQETIHIDVDGKSLKILLEYIYTGKISIDSENVIGLLQAANYLWLEEVKEFCFEYLKSIISPRNCAEIYKVAELYSNDSLKQDVYKMVKENYKEVSESEGFINLPYEQFFTCLYKNIHLIDDELLCKSIIKWVKHDESNRKERLTILIRLVHFEKLSSIFLQTIIAEMIVQENEKSMELINQRLSSLPNDTKIISIGGDSTKNKVITVWPLNDKSPLQYPDLPDSYSDRCSLRGDMKCNKYLFCMGGISSRRNLRLNPISRLDIMTVLSNPMIAAATLGIAAMALPILTLRSSQSVGIELSDKVWRLDTNESNLKWQLVSSMKTKRSYMGGAVFKGSLVVADGWDGKKILKSTEAYNFQSDEWLELALLKQKRDSNQLVVCNRCLYAVGGHDGSSALSSVERLRELNGKWEDAPSMQTPRWLFAIVVCDDVIYAIGGVNAEGQPTKSVEKFDPAADERWVYVSDMNIERWAHSACVFNDKIFVVGGKNARNKFVKEIECFDPSIGRWEIVGEIEDKLCGHSLIVL